MVDEVDISEGLKQIVTENTYITEPQGYEEVSIVHGHLAFRRCACLAELPNLRDVYL